MIVGSPDARASSSAHAPRGRLRAFRSGRTAGRRPKRRRGHRPAGSPLARSGAGGCEWVAAPGVDTGLHVHERLEETWYVLDGELEFRVGEEAFKAALGACDFVPPRVPHAFAEPRPGAREIPPDDVSTHTRSLLRGLARSLLRGARGDPQTRRAAQQRGDCRLESQVRRTAAFLAHDRRRTLRVW